MTEDRYEVRSLLPEAAIAVCSAAHPDLVLKITLSSPAVREELGGAAEGTDASSARFDRGARTSS